MSSAISGESPIPRAAHPAISISSSNNNTPSSSVGSPASTLPMPPKSTSHLGRARGSGNKVVIPGFTTTAPLDRSLSDTPAKLEAARDGEQSARIVSAMVGDGALPPGPPPAARGFGSVTGGQQNHPGSSEGQNRAASWNQSAYYGQADPNSEDIKRKRAEFSTVSKSSGNRVPTNNWDYSSDEMSDGGADDSDDEDIEREPLPGEKIFSRIREGDGYSDEEGDTVYMKVRGEEVDELESVNGDNDVAKSGQGGVKKIKLVLNSNGGMSKDKSKMGKAGEAKLKKRSVRECDATFERMSLGRGLLQWEDENAFRYPDGGKGDVSKETSTG